MKKIHRVLALLLAALMAFGLLTTAFAATDSAPTIDPGKKASLSIYKYDITTASNDGAWDVESYVSTGLHDDAVIDKLSKYAIQGVEFTYLRIADITMNNEVLDGQRQVGVLYGFDNSERSNAVLSAIGLTAADAHKTEGGVNYFTSDMLNNKLSAALTANATTVKNALEAAVKNGGVAMPETDATGHAYASDMEQGLYLIVETRVPENVTFTCNPFFVSLPMTTIDGAAWNYDVTVYPKNQTGNPNLDKTVREAKNSTGKNTGSLTDITDGYAHTTTASVGDTVDYQIISTLPTITSKASALSEYTYVDIPKIGAYLPVQHGTDADTLERAVGHVVGTSLPVGGSSTHAVLSAHSGMASAKLFSDIDQLAEGDTFYIHVLGDTLAYKVDAINTVLPTDTRLLQIEDGKDYVTLVTCTPFGINTHRLLVRGHRVPYVPEQEATAAAEKPVASSWTRHYLAGLGIGLGAAAVVGGGYFLVRRVHHA